MGHLTLNLDDKKEKRKIHGRIFDWSEYEKHREPKIDEYRGKDGLIYCKTCGRPRQSKITFDSFDREFQKQILDLKAKHPKKYLEWEQHFLGVRPVPCDCKREEIDRRERQMKAEEEKRRLTDLREFRGIDTSETFENSDKINRKAMTTAKRYVEMFGHGSEIYSMLFYGGAITGKTFAANCVGNGLSDLGYTVFCTTVEGYLNMKEQHKTPPEAKIWIIDDLKPLKEYGYRAKFVTELIESRKQKKLPTIVTSRLECNNFLNNADDNAKKLGAIFSRYVRVSFTENHSETLMQNAVEII